MLSEFQRIRDKIELIGSIIRKISPVVSIDKRRESGVTKVSSPDPVQGAMEHPRCPGSALQFREKRPLRAENGSARTRAGIDRTAINGYDR